jgi:asparagine synthase (glutamine-hydrolysing)
MSFGYTTGFNTSFKNIKKLPPSHILEYDGRDISIKKYWDLSYENIEIDYEEAVKETYRLINDSVKLRLLSDLEVGCFLSGGIDSSLIASIMQKNSSSKINTFSIGFENKKYDESIYAKNVANHLNTNHYNYIFKEEDVFNLINENKSSFDEPFGDASALPMNLLARETKKSVTVALSGDGGDELFIGYDRYFKTQKFLNLFSKIPLPLRKFSSLLFNISNIDKIEKLSYAVKHPNVLNAYSILFTHIKPWELKNIFNFEFLENSLYKQNFDLEYLLGFHLNSMSNFKKFRQIDLNSYLCDDILTKVDRMTMKHSLEARVPILDHRIIEFANSIPTKIHLKYGSKSILKTILNQYIPRNLYDRPKAGFAVPLKHWFRGKLKDVIKDKINNLDHRFNKKYLNKIFLEHQKGKNFEYVLWNILQL